MGWSNQAVVLVVLEEEAVGFSGLFGYSPYAGPGNLLLSAAARQGTDPDDNEYLPGLATYGTGAYSGLVAMQLYKQSLTWYGASSETGPWIAINALALEPIMGAVSTTGSFEIAGAEVWIKPTGDTSGATDTVHINDYLAAGYTVHLLPGQYYVDDTITVPTGGALVGPFPVQADTNSGYGAGDLALQGPVIHAAGAFTGDDPPPAVIECYNSTDTQEGGQVLANFSIEANTTPSGSGVFGILLHGAVAAGYISGVTVHRPDGACLRVQTDTGTGYVPDQWTVENCTFAASRSSHGVQADIMPDSSFVNCLSHNNAMDGWHIGGFDNSRMIGCKGENNGNAGFHLGGLSVTDWPCEFTSCTSQLNQEDGWLFDNSLSGVFATYLLTGCRSMEDGQAGGTTYAGFRSSGNISRIMATGALVVADATGPYYGAAEESSSYGMCFTASSLGGVHAATYDDGSNTHALVNQEPVPF